MIDMLPSASNPLRTPFRRLFTCASLFLFVAGAASADQPLVLDSTLSVKTVVSGLNTPTTMAFLGPDEMLVLEKNTGKVQHVAGGAVAHTALDLGVNNAVERGLLGIALDPAFSSNRFVYLYWTCMSEQPVNPFMPSARTCPDMPQLGADTGNILAVPLLGNRVDRFVWDPGAFTLTFDRNLIKLRSFQNDGAPDPPGQDDQTQGPAGNHNGGVLRFGQDGKLYIFIGDNGRRGALQNLPAGPTPTGVGIPVPDDQFGGPAPDDAHFTGVIIRLNPDGSTPADNPFFRVGAIIPGEAGKNIQKIFAYGFRNSFGTAVDPRSGDLWMSENGDDAFDEINRVFPGMNSGWIQIMGPLDRLAQYRAIETSQEHFGLQQLRWPPTGIAQNPVTALMRLFQLPGSRFSNPEFSWKFALAPAAIGFMNGPALGLRYMGDLFVGFAENEPLGGPLFRFRLTNDRRHLDFSDPRLQDRVADNRDKDDTTESESLFFGVNFGAVTDIQTGPDGNLYVVSLTNGAVYKISRSSEEQ